MNRLSQSLAGGLAVLVSAVVSAEPAASDSSKKAQAGIPVYNKVVNVSADDTLNMRADSSSDSPILAKLAPGTVLLRLGENKGWVNVIYRGQPGWVYSKYIARTKAPDFADADLAGLACTGTEPHWKLGAQASRISYGMYGEMQDYYLDGVVTPAMNYRGLWSASAYSPGTDKNDLSSHISMIIESDPQCSDDMSETRYSYSIVLMNEGYQLLRGCCKYV